MAAAPLGLRLPLAPGALTLRRVGDGGVDVGALGEVGAVDGKFGVGGGVREHVQAAQ